MGRNVGVDGCKTGWIAVTSDDAGLVFAISPTMLGLLDLYPEAEVILVDVPIGLPWRGCMARPCDAAARKLLGPRAPSVFSAPCRAAAHAPTVARAREMNNEEVGKSLSAQAWGICKKIAQVDALLLGDAHARTVIREMHPEVCFFALNGAKPMANAKRTIAGQAERLELLSRYEPGSTALLQAFRATTLRKHAQTDDLLDALVGHVTALKRPQPIAVAAGSATRDALDLPIKMVCAS